MAHTRYRSAMGAALILAARAAGQTGGGVPWFGYGPVDTAYALAIDTTVAFTGRWSMLLRSLPGATAQTWMASQQIVDARAYRNKRIRLHAYLRTQRATAAGLWFAVEGFTNRRPTTLLLDTLVSPRHGTTSWGEATAVFDVDARTTCVRFGSMLYGGGAVWLDDISFDVVSTAVPLTVRAQRPRLVEGGGTDQPNCAGMIPTPTNLDFEQPPF